MDDSHRLRQFRLQSKSAEERADAVLVAACDAFVRRLVYDDDDMRQFGELCSRLYSKASLDARAQAMSILAEASELPLGLAAGILARDDMASLDFLRHSKALDDATLKNVIARNDIEMSDVIAARDDLTNNVLSKLFPINSRRLYRTMAANPSIRLNGPYLNAMLRAAKMDFAVAESLAERAEIDAGVLVGGFFNLSSTHRMHVLNAFKDRQVPSSSITNTFEQLSVATEEFTAALMKLYTQNRRAEVTKLFSQITGLDEIRCGEIAHDVSGEALFVVLRAFGCRSYDGLRVLIHAMSVQEFDNRRLPAFATLFDSVPQAAAVHILSVWRGETDPTSLEAPTYRPLTQDSNRTPTTSAQPAQSERRDKRRTTTPARFGQAS